jgi:hypothetical protein
MFPLVFVKSEHGIVNGPPRKTSPTRWLRLSQKPKRRSIPVHDRSLSGMPPTSCKGEHTLPDWAERRRLSRHFSVTGQNQDATGVTVTALNASSLEETMAEERRPSRS